MVARDKRDWRGEREFKIRGVSCFTVRQAHHPEPRRRTRHGPGTLAALFSIRQEKESISDSRSFRENRRVTPGSLVKRSACPTGAASWLRSAGLSSERAQKTIRSRVQDVRLRELKPASGLRRHGDEGRKSHAFPERRRKAPSRLPARLFLLVDTTNRQSSSLIPYSAV